MFSDRDDVVLDKCLNCGCGTEVCSYCHDLPTIDFEVVCDCGLYDFGAHLFDCETRERNEDKWLI